MTRIDFNKRILDANEQAALDNAELFKSKSLRCLNMISSPGSGKTTILARTITDLKGQLNIGVIEGDIQTELDAQRIRATGAPAVQINTHGACHLNAEQIARALKQLPLDTLGMIVIENIGNLVCPSAFELGEHAKVVVLSTAEGDDKPIKYPGTFSKAKAVIINKIDLLTALEFDLDRVRADISSLAPDCKIFELSARTGTGMSAWYDWLLGLTKS